MDKLKVILKQLLKYAHIHKKTQPDIFIFTLPRTGSTLLAEILNTTKHSKSVLEPFNMNRQTRPIIAKYIDDKAISERYFQLSNHQLDCIKIYLEDLSAGKLFNAYSWSDINTAYHSFKTENSIFKIHKISYYFDDIMNHFTSDYGLYLLRHPISHSLSRIRNNWSHYIKEFSTSEKIINQLTLNQNKLITETHNSNDILSKFVLSWCLENFVFLNAQRNNTLNNNVIPIYYERIIINTKKTINELYNFIQTKPNKAVFEIVNKPSKGVIHSSKETQKQILSKNKVYLIDRWQSQVSNTQLSNCQLILDAFNITIYNTKQSLPILK